MLERWAQRAVQRQAGSMPRPNHGARLLLALLLLFTVLSIGCATALVTVGRTYYVQWPGQMPDVVEIHGVRRDGWVQCRSVTDTVIWACNLNTAIYFVRVTPSVAPQGQRTD